MRSASLILKDRVCLITGAGRGIGRAVALTLAEAGASIVGISRTKMQVDKTIESVNEMGGRGISVVGDITSKTVVKNLVATVAREFQRIDILINNAGIAPKTSRVSVQETTVSDWELIMNVNLKGCFLVIKEALDLMKKNGQGHIVNIASVAGKKALSGESCAYHASKFALIGFSKVLEQDLKDSGISVSAICPGRVFTGMGEPMDPCDYDATKWLKPEDIAEIVLFLVTRNKNIIIPEIVIYPRDQIGSL
jgi:NAD(P)-dependent dehydrogenase (short-subunit alcohol dehydrogenase family)